MMHTEKLEMLESDSACWSQASALLSRAKTLLISELGCPWARNMKSPDDLDSLRKTTKHIKRCVSEQLVNILLAEGATRGAWEPTSTRPIRRN